MITFWRETSPKSLPPGNSEGSSQNITWFLETHFNHQFKINITAKRSYQSKDNQVFSFWQAGLWMCGSGYRGILLFELKYVVWFLEIQVLIDSFIH